MSSKRRRISSILIFFLCKRALIRMEDRTERYIAGHVRRCTSRLINYVTSSSVRHSIGGSDCDCLFFPLFFFFLFHVFGAVLDAVDKNNNNIIHVCAHADRFVNVRGRRHKSNGKVAAAPNLLAPSTTV